MVQQYDAVEDDSAVMEIRSINVVYSITIDEGGLRTYTCRNYLISTEVPNRSMMFISTPMDLSHHDWCCRGRARAQEVLGAWKEGKRSFAGPTTPPRSPNLTPCVGVVRHLLQNSEGDEDR